jgi:hypothetical protein
MKVKVSPTSPIRTPEDVVRYARELLYGPKGQGGWVDAKRDVEVEIAVIKKKLTLRRPMRIGREQLRKYLPLLLNVSYGN